MHRFLVQLDSTTLDVLRASMDEFGLVRQERERDIVDADSKFVCHNVIENCNFPLCFAVLQLERKYALLSKFFPSYKFFGFVQSDL